jgi:phage baseplate assembly protein V
MTMPRGAPPEGGGYGVVAALVTDNDDPDKLGRVKVRYPWMGSDESSDWIRVAAPGAGKDAGFFFVPEPQDQVLVSFLYGRVDRAYVVGSLWSRNDKPPGGEHATRIIKSRSGHTIVLDDTKDAEQITIVDKSGKNKIVLDAKNNAVTIQSGGDLTLKAEGKLALEAKGDLTLKGNNVSIEGNAKVAAKGQQMTLDGPTGVKINGGALEVM